jgi:hypothetical protein
MGSGFNHSLASGRAARRKATVTTAAQYWLDVPVYVYSLPCGETHEFRSRTPATSFDGFYFFWCERCKMIRAVRAIDHQPYNRPHSTDEIVAFEQDKGIIRERLARFIQHSGFLETEEQLAQTAALYGVPVSEVRRINAGMVPKAVYLPTVELCKARKHEMVENNWDFVNGRKTCKACRRERQRARRAANKIKKGDAAAPSKLEGKVST